MYSSFSSQSALLTMTASVGPSPNVRNWPNTRLMLAMLAAICSSVSILRLSSRPVGSPILVVPPPIRTTGLWPVRWSRRSIMIETR